MLEHAYPKTKVLGNTKVPSKPAHLDSYVPPNHRCARGEHVTRREKAIGRAKYERATSGWSVESIDDAVPPAAEGGGADEYVIAAQLPQMLEVIGQPLVVGVKKRQPFARSCMCRGVARSRRAPVLKMPNHPCPELLGHESGAVPGPVVHDNHLGRKRGAL